MNKYMIPQCEVKLSKNQLNILKDIITKHIENDKDDIIRYAEMLIIKKKLEEADKMLRQGVKFVYFRF